MKFSELLKELENNAEIHSFSLQQNPKLNPEIQGVAAINEAYSGSLSFVDREKFIAEVENTSASVLILPLNEELQQKANEREIAWIATAQPRLLFAKTIALFYTPYSPPPGIHPTAVIDSSVELGENVSIAAHVVISEGVKIGDNVCIFPNVVIYPGVEIGNRTILHANCTIHERSRIGQDCVIHSGTVIGAEGFGFVPIPEGWYKMQQSGCTVLENGVEVGCNTSIDRPAVGETRIGQNTKIDNLVQIGHGCTIGENCAIAGQVGMAGGVQIGNRVILAGQAGISNQAKIGDGAIATAKAGIHSDVEPGAIVTGIPAISHKLFLKATAVYNRLPEMYKTLKQLKKQIEDKT